MFFVSERTFNHIYQHSNCKLTTRVENSCSSTTDSIFVCVTDSNLTINSINSIDTDGTVYTINSSKHYAHWLTKKCCHLFALLPGTPQNQFHYQRLLPPNVNLNTETFFVDFRAAGQNNLFSRITFFHYTNMIEICRKVQSIHMTCHHLKLRTGNY